MYVVTASLCFLVFVALKQVQAAVKGTQVRGLYVSIIHSSSLRAQRTIKEYEQAARGTVPVHKGPEDTVVRKRSGPRRVLKK